MTTLQELYAEGVTETREPKKTKLWASDVGKCPRSVMFRVLAYPVTHPFNTVVREAMALGNAYETATFDGLGRVLGPRLTADPDQLWLSHGVWSARADGIVDIDTPNAMIIEHKAMGSKWWDYKSQLPKPEHVCQLAMYGWLYYQTHGAYQTLRLVYRAWGGHWAEFDLTGDVLARLNQNDPARLVVTGYVDGEVRKRTLDIDMEFNRQMLEHWYEAQELPPLPWEPLDGCTFQGKPSCLYYGHCWSKE